MKITAESLQEQWKSVNYCEGGFLRVDVEHPLEWYIGYASSSRKTLMLISDKEIKPVESSKSISVNCGLRETDGRWTLRFELIKQEQNDVFVVLCNDIIEFSRSAKDAATALTSVIKRYRQWDKLLEHQKKGLMDESSRKGLIGELLFLKERIDKSGKAMDALQGWCGPEGADQDFVYSDGWYEIKTLALSADTVSISSLEQLGAPGIGWLSIMRVDKCPPQQSGAFTLNEIVRSVAEHMADKPDCIELFETKLMKYGYMDMPEYSDQTYSFHGKKDYTVDGLFPKLIRESVPHQIVETKYILSIAGINDWERQ